MRRSRRVRRCDEVARASVALPGPALTKPRALARRAYYRRRAKIDTGRRAGKSSPRCNICTTRPCLARKASAPRDWCLVSTTWLCREGRQLMSALFQSRRRCGSPWPCAPAPSRGTAPRYVPCSERTPRVPRPAGAPPARVPPRRRGPPPAAGLGRLKVSDSGRSGACNLATTASHDFLSRISPTGTPSIAVSARPTTRSAGQSCSAALTRGTPALRSKDSSMPKGPWKMRSIAASQRPSQLGGMHERAALLCLFFFLRPVRLRAAQNLHGFSALQCGSLEALRASLMSCRVRARSQCKDDLRLRASVLHR